MDNIEITVFDEIKDYKEKIYFFNIRQWIFAILITAIVVPLYLVVKPKIGDEATSYIVIAVAGVLGFIGFVKIHELPAEKIIPYWFRHYTIFARPIHYITDKDFDLQHQKKGKSVNKVGNANKVLSAKDEIRELKRKQKEAMMLEKARKKYGKLIENKEEEKIVNNKIDEEKNKSIENTEIKKIDTKEKIEEEKSLKDDELSEKLSKLTKEQQDALLKLLER